MSGISVVLGCAASGCAPLDNLSAYSEESGAEDPAGQTEPTDGSSEGDAQGAGDDALPRVDPTEPASADEGSGDPGRAEGSATDVALDPGSASAGEGMGSAGGAEEPASIDEMPGVDDPPETSPDADAVDAEPIEPDPPAAVPVEPLVPLVRFVRLVADSEVEGLPFTSVAELDLIGANGADLPARDGWVASADSAEAAYVGGAAAGFAIDGDPVTLWHTPWSPLFFPDCPPALG